MAGGQVTLGAAWLTDYPAERQRTLAFLNLQFGPLSKQNVTAAELVQRLGLGQIRSFDGYVGL